MDLAPIIGASIAALSAISGIFVANWFNSKNQSQAHKWMINKSKRETKLVKSEELYLALSRWQKYVTNIYMYHIRYFVGKLTFNQLNQIVVEHNNDGGKKIDELTMLVNVHFPELKADLELIQNMTNTLAKYLNEDSPKKYSLDEFITDQSCFDAVCSSFLDKLALTVREL